MKAGLRQIPIQGAAPRLAGNREWDGLPMPTRFWGILAVAFGVSLSVIDGAIANVALPTMARMLGISSANSIWIVNAYQLAISSTKSMTGHMLGAAGAVEALFCAKMLQEGYLPATINYQVPDPACDLDVVPNQGRSADVRYALSNSLGFGGHNACVLFKKWEG